MKVKNSISFKKSVFENFVKFLEFFVFFCFKKRKWAVLLCGWKCQPNDQSNKTFFAPKFTIGHNERVYLTPTKASLIFWVRPKAHVTKPPSSQKNRLSLLIFAWVKNPPAHHNFIRYLKSFYYCFTLKYLTKLEILSVRPFTLQI